MFEEICRFRAVEQISYLDGSKFVVDGSNIVMLLKQSPLDKTHVKVKQASFTLKLVLWKQNVLEKEPKYMNIFVKYSHNFFALKQFILCMETRF